MPRIQEDFSKISTEFEQLPPGEYRMAIDEIEEQTAEDADNPALIFKSVVTEGDKAESVCWDYVYLKTNKGKKNKIGLGRLKAYAVAILGEEAANNAEGYDTDDLLKGTFLGVIEQETYEKKDGSGQATASRLKKVLPVG